MRMRFAALLLFFIGSTGCFGAAWDHTEVPPPPPPPPGEVAQYCTYNGANDLDVVNAFLAAQARAGWELVSLGGQQGSVYCFRSIARH
jgi:hypothetical protein